MSARIAGILAAALALPSLALATAEEDVATAIRGRLDAVRRNEIDAWARFVADDMMAPLEGVTRSKEGWIRSHRAWPREVTEPGEWLPESDTTFFVPGAAAGGDSSRIVFVRDAAGRVTHYLYRELGATERIVRKIH